MEFRELIDALAEKTGVREGIEIDAQNRCLMEFDDMGVVIQGIDEVGTLTLMSVLGEPPPERLEGLYRALLEANHLFRGTFGATLSVDPDNGSVFLCKCIPYAALDGDSFVKELENFVNAVESWRTVVTEFRASADAPTATEGSVEGLSDAGSFLRV